MPLTIRHSARKSPIQIHRVLASSIGVGGLFTARLSLRGPRGVFLKAFDTVVDLDCPQNTYSGGTVLYDYLSVKGELIVYDLPSKDADK